MAEGQPLTGATAPWIAADGAGAAQIAACDGSLALNPTAIGSGQNRVGIANLTRFGAEKDYSVTWKECVTQTAKGGVLMRGTYANGGGNPGLTDGYYFQALTDLAEGTTRMAIRKVTNRADGTTAFDNGTQGEVAIAAPEAGRPRWYRATCKGNLLTFEYSDDGREFTRAVARTDGIYPSAGITQLLWGHTPHLPLRHRRLGHKRRAGNGRASPRGRHVAHPARGARRQADGTRRVHRQGAENRSEIKTHGKCNVSAPACNVSCPRRNEECGRCG